MTTNRGLTMMDKTKSAAVLQMIADDMAADAIAFDGMPFTGRTVAEYFGNQGAALAAIANIVKGLFGEPAAVDAGDPDGR